MKSVYIITGGILVMMAVVLLAPQKKTSTIVEEKTSSQLDEIDAIILKEYRDDLTPEEKELARQDVAEELARDKAEMRKYGRLLTADERSEQWWREQDEAEERAAYAQLYEERKDWIDNFPFQPRYHPDIVYDPENIAHSDEKLYAYQKELERKSDEAMERYDAEVDNLWARTDLTREEKEKADDELFRAVKQADEAIQNPDPEIMAERRVIMRHKRLAGFYEQNYRYLPEFEQAYRIFEEEGAGDNPLRIANTMIPLESYFMVSGQANQHGFDELHPVQTRWDPNTRQTHRITWGEQLERHFRCIVGNMMSQRNLIPGEENITREQAERIRDRLVAEILPDGFTGNTFLVGMMNPKDEDMVPGQSLLAE